jgi:hypothetical protein
MRDLLEYQNWISENVSEPANYTSNQLVKMYLKESNCESNQINRNLINKNK